MRFKQATAPSVDRRSHNITRLSSPPETMMFAHIYGRHRVVVPPFVIIIIVLVRVRVVGPVYVSQRALAL